MTSNPARESSKFIFENSTHVSINLENLRPAAEKIFQGMKRSSYSTTAWKEHPLHPKVADENSINWIFLCDLLNFSFWTEGDIDSRFSVEYHGQHYTGYWSLCALINRALENHVPFTSPAFYAEAAPDTLASLFKSDSEQELPLLLERLQILNETGNILMKKYQGSFVNCIKKADHSALKLLDLIYNDFSAFQDFCTYKERRVFLLKRAQILVADIWGCFEGKGLGYFKDIDEITMFADYRIPQVLQSLNLLTYQPELQAKVEKRISLPPGSEEEVEIRGNSIWAVELLTQQLQKDYDISVNAILVDFYLWVLF